ncbi:HAMP domain-containing histidine kinase [Sphingobium sp. BHU LFT2]|uniref:histidine kinase dimerization/phospho-acceptor domain-containing protein n=1 Tax=Sphingobium sp. BHU LFT2 TaxID=2807634 RepID=UPI001BE8A95D|nr:HAMP domain-containing sensor histidine kinase [Sphingobium sp. BHU LFT2]MBT2246751.1 HAMP domain-containing histidine kinase [Sphingobium sp. BHU LFT2]
MFVAGLAHELRTPLAVLKGRLHALEDGVIDPASGECGRLLEQVDRLLRITDGLTTLAQAYGGELLLDRRSVDLSLIVAHALSETHAAANASAIGLQAPHEAIMLSCDPARMSQALGALIRFALLHVPLGSSLAVRWSASSDEAVLKLHCANWTVGRDEENNLYVPIWEAGNGAPDNRPTSNIDAALAAALISAHGGNLEIVDEPSVQRRSIVARLPRKGSSTLS